MRILITSGGGAKGAFSVGAVQHLLTRFNSFDFISGTSTGSAIAALTAAGKIAEMVTIYRTTDNAKILRPTDLVDSITSGNPFIYDTLPLEQQMDTHIDAAAFQTIMQSGITLCFNAVCLQTGKITVFSTVPINASPKYDQVRINDLTMLKKAILGSSNQAVFMPPVTVNGLQFADGGNREVVPTRVVVTNISPAQSHEIYILSNNPDQLVRNDTTFTDILQVLFRTITMFIQEVRENDLETLVNFKNNATGSVKIFYIRPDSELDVEFPTGLRFDPIRMRFWIQLGEQKARNILDNNPNGNLGLFV